MDKTRELKKKIDKLQHETAQVSSEHQIKKSIHNIVKTIRAALVDTQAADAPYLLIRLGIVKEVGIDVVSHQSGKKIFTAAKSHKIIYSLGNNSQERIGAYADSDLNVIFVVDKVLPRYFRMSQVKQPD